MEAKYGRERLDDLEANATTRKWTRSELLEIEAYYKDKIKRALAGDYGENFDTPTSVMDMFSVKKT